MNEKIKELAKQSGISFKPFIANDEEYDFDDVFVDDSTIIEKFAELIVKECLSVIKSEYSPIKEDDYLLSDPYWRGQVANGVDTYIAVRKHFGIGE